MILVDSSIWIDFFSHSPGAGGAELRRMITEAEPFALTGLVVAEVLQGLTRDAERIQGYLAQWDMLEPAGFETYSHAAAIYRAARAKGITPTTIDTIIAAIALEHNASVFTLDRDFSRIAAFSSLAVHKF